MVFLKNYPETIQALSYDLSKQKKYVISKEKSETRNQKSWALPTF